MRRRRHLRGPWVLVAAFVVSGAVHLPLGLGLQTLIPRWLAAAPKDRAPARKPVEVVRLTPSAYESTLAKARRVVPPKTEAQKRKEQAKREEEERRERDKNGQVVEVASEDKRPPKEARYLSKENSRVERETVARNRDPNEKRVTAKLQKATSRGEQGRGIPVPGLQSSGDGGKQGGAQGQGKEKRRRFQLEMPKLARREAVELDITKLPELSAGRIFNRERREAVPGRGRTLDVGRDSRDADEATPGERGSGARTGLPRLEDLRPTLGTIARISGSPSSDYVENVPEGEGTFLNAREFKYATFFYQVRDSVAPYWRSDLRTELRRRDPAGNTFGFANVQTVLFIRLDTAGRLSQVKVQKSSGYQFFDALAVRAFEQAESFPNPPAGMVEDGHVDFNFLFVLTPPRRGPLGLFR